MAFVRTYWLLSDTGKQMIWYAACIIWDKVPLNLKELSIYTNSQNNWNLIYCQNSITQPKHILFHSYYIVH